VAPGGRFGVGTLLPASGLLRSLRNSLLQPLRNRLRAGQGLPAGLLRAGVLQARLSATALLPARLLRAGRLLCAGFMLPTRGASAKIAGADFGSIAS
jgi:hypothetical protein